MSNQKITDLSSLPQSSLDAAADFLLLVDSSNTSMSTTGTNVKINPKSLIGGSISDLSQTWDNASAVFTGLKLNITDTASDASSNLLDLQVGSLSKFRIAKDGTIYVNGSVFSGGSWGSITGTLSAQTDLQNALNAKADSSSLASYLPLSGGTLTGSLFIPIGSVGSPGIAFSTDSDTGIYSSTANTIDFVLGGTTRHQFQSDGSIKLGGTDPWIYHTNFTIRSPSSGVINLRGSLNASAATVNLGTLNTTGNVTIGSTDLILARDTANTLAQRNANNSQVFRIYRQYTDGSNYSRFFVNTNATGSKIAFGTERAGTGSSVGVDFYVNGTKMIDFNAGSVDIYFTGRSLTWGTANSGEVRLKQPTAFNGRLHVVDAASDAIFSDLVLGKIWFWGVTSSHILLKRSSTTLQSRLGDDSGFASFQGKLTTDTNYTAGAPTATGYLILYDATGTAYRVPAVLN